MVLAHIEHREPPLLQASGDHPLLVAGHEQPQVIRNEDGRGTVDVRRVPIDHELVRSGSRAVELELLRWAGNDFRSL